MARLIGPKEATLRVGTKQRAISVSEAYQADDGKWYVNLDVFSDVGTFAFRVTPLQGARIAADLMASWRSWETMMKNPRT